MKKLYSILNVLLALTLVASISAFSASKTWNTTNGGAWTTPGNWNPSGVPAPGDDITFNANSAAITAIPAISLHNVTFNNSITLQTVASGNVMTITGTMTLASGATLTAGATSGARGDMTIASGAFAVINGTYNQSQNGANVHALNVNGTITFSATGTFTGSGSFIMGAGSTIKTANTAGITSSGATGSVQNSGTRTIPVSVNFEYNGTSAQNTGNGLLTAHTGTLTINSGNTVTLSSACSIANGNSVTVAAGTFAAGTNLTMSSTSTINMTGGLMTGTPAGAGVYNVNYSGNSITTGGELAGTGLNNVTVAMTAGQTLTLGANRAPDGNVTVSSGTFTLGANTIARSAAGGTFTVSNGATLNIGGTNGFPGSYNTHTLGGSSIVDYSGSTQTVSADTYGLLKIDNAGTKSLAGTTTAAGDVAISTGTLACGANSFTFQGSLTNDGSVTSTGTITANGTSAQLINGANTIAFNNLTINNTSGGVSSIAGTSVTGTLTMSSGILTPSGTLSIGSASGGTSTSYVNGKISQSCAAATATSFPVGNTGYAPVTITSTSTGTYAVSTTAGAPTPVVNSGTVLQRTYLINAPGGNADLVLGYPAGDASGTPSAYEASVFDGSQWNPIGGTGSATSTSVSGINFGSGDSQWSAGEPGGLPIQVMSFNAVSAAKSGVSINWSTATETNNLGFYVERRAQGSTSFATVSGLIQGAGSSLEQHDYSYTDATVGNGTYYYRLKQVDANGGASYSGEIKIVVNGALGVSDNKVHTYQLAQNYPNPFNPTTNIAFDMPEQGIVTLKVFNVIGQEVATLVNGVQYNAGEAKIAFNAASLSSGVYYYHLNVKGVSSTFESIKKMMLVK